MLHKCVVRVRWMRVVCVVIVYECLYGVRVWDSAFSHHSVDECSCLTLTNTQSVAKHRKETKSSTRLHQAESNTPSVRSFFFFSFSSGLIPFWNENPGLLVRICMGVFLCSYDCVSFLPVSLHLSHRVWEWMAGVCPSCDPAEAWVSMLTWLVVTVHWLHWFRLCASLYSAAWLTRI